MTQRLKIQITHRIANGLKEEEGKEASNACHSVGLRNTYAKHGAAKPIEREDIYGPRTSRPYHSMVTSLYDQYNLTSTWKRTSGRQCGRALHRTRVDLYMSLLRRTSVIRAMLPIPGFTPSLPDKFTHTLALFMSSDSDYDCSTYPRTT